jgi:hypothetical protein
MFGDVAVCVFIVGLLGAAILALAGLAWLVKAMAISTTELLRKGAVTFRQSSTSKNNDSAAAESRTLKAA